MGNLTSSVFVRIYLFFHGRAAPLVGGALLVLLAAGALSSRLTVHEDITTLLPTRPAGLVEQFALLREAPFLHGLTITVSGDDPGRAADTLAQALRGPDIPRVISGAGAALAPRTLARLCAFLPSLVPVEQLRALSAYVEEDAMRQALTRDARLLLTPGGLALRDILALDPLGMCAGMLRRLAPSPEARGPRLENGRLLSADGKHALIFAEPAAPLGDAKAMRNVMERIRDAARSLPEGAAALIVGGARHAEENAESIQGDLFRVLPLSCILLAVLFALFVRSWQGLVIFALPTASLAVAAACTGIAYGGLSGIVLGFGSVVLGITADYGIHVYYALRAGQRVADSLERVSRPLVLGAATTLIAFAAFFSSSIPCVIQMTWFAICGVIAALALALVVLPHCLRPACAPPDPQTLAAGGRRGRRRLGLLWCVTACALAALLHDVPINGDIKALSFVSEANARDEARTQEIWGGLLNQAMLVVKAGSLEQALEKNDLLWAELARSAPENGVDPRRLTSLAPLLPAASTQAARHAAWTHFWRDKGTDALDRLARLAPEAGFSAEAFAPFRAWIRDEPALLQPETLSDNGMVLPLLLVRRTADASLVYTLLPSDAPPAFLSALPARHEAAYVSGNSFRAALDAATRDDLFRFGLLSLAAICVTTAAALRSPFRFGVALLPVAAGLLSVLSVFRLLDIQMNIFHAMALPLVMGLSVDYGIFMLARMEGALDSASGRGVLLSGLTTLSGFGSLLLARHPALFSLGTAVSLGLAASLATAVFVLPRLCADPVPHRDAHG